MNITDNLLKWTPYSVIILMATATFLGIIIWYALHFQEPPTWLLTTFAAIGGGGLIGIGTAHGVSVANGIAKDTAVAVVQATSEHTKEGTP